MIVNLFRIVSIIAAFVLSSLTISKGPGLDGGYQGLKGIPIPYDYAWSPTFPSSQNNLVYAVDFFFWIIILNLAINFVASRTSIKTLGAAKKLFTKELVYILIASTVLFLVSLVFHMAF